MYWEGVKAFYHWGEDESVIMITSVKKSIVEYGSGAMTYSLRCNCTPDVAMNVIRFFPEKFREKTGFELVGNVKVVDNRDRKMFTFFGTVRRGNVVVDLPVIIGNGSLFDEVKSEALFQMRYVDEPPKGMYVYFDGRENKFFDSFEELVDAVVRNRSFPSVKEYFGDEYLRLFPGVRTYFRDCGRRSVFVVNDSSVVVYGPGESASIVGSDDPVHSFVAAKKSLGGHPEGAIVFGEDVRKGKYYVKEGRYWLRRDMKKGDDYWEDFLYAGEDYGARGGLVSSDAGVLVFDDFIVVGSKRRGVLQKVRMGRPRTRFGTMYRYLYFAPYVDSFDVSIVGDVGLSMYALMEEIDLKII